MATILRGSYNIDQIEALANLIKDNAGFSDTDFSVSGVYDFIVNSKVKLRLKAASATTLGFYTVANGIEASITSNTYLNIRMVVTAKATAIGVYAYTAAGDVPINQTLLIRAESKSTYDNSIDDILIKIPSATNYGNINLYAPDMLGFNTADSMGAAPSMAANIYNTVLFKISGTATYYIPESVYYFRTTNASVNANYYNFILVNNVYESIGYWALRDDEV